MIQKYKYKNVLWVIVEAPTQEELESLVNEHSLPKQIENALAHENGNAFYSEHQTTFVALEFPRRIKNPSSVPIQLQCIVSPSTLITIHKVPSDHSNQLFRDFELLTLSKAVAPENLTHVLLSELIKKHYLQSLSEINDTVTDQAYLHTAVPRLLETYSQQINTKNVLTTHQESLKQLHKLYGDEKYQELIQLHKELSSAIDTFAQLLKNTHTYTLANLVQKYNQRFTLFIGALIILLLTFILLSFRYLIR